jgi:hypothetical protein
VAQAVAEFEDESAAVPSLAMAALSTAHPAAVVEPSAVSDRPPALSAVRKVSNASMPFEAAVENRETRDLQLHFPERLPTTQIVSAFGGMMESTFNRSAFEAAEGPPASLLSARDAAFAAAAADSQETAEWEIGSTNAGELAGRAEPDFALAALDEVFLSAW